MVFQKIKTPVTFLLFGASGDLAELKIFPALYELALQKRFARPYIIMGFARTPMTDEAFREHVKKSIQDHTDPLILDPKVLAELLSHVTYHQGQYDQEKDFEKLATRLATLHQGKTTEHLAFYALPPSVYLSVTQNLAAIRESLKGPLKLMIEKPFGQNYESARALFQKITDHFQKENLYLIDHYLGKAAVQSLLPLRTNNAILNLLLKGETISNIQISALETAGVEERISYFENVGIIKDMIQSHLLQILALLLMKIPVRRDIKSIRREKGNILSALRYPADSCGVTLGQYASYRQQEGVAPDSQTPTFAALRFFMDLTEWVNVPIYIRAGKKTAHKHTLIVVEFKRDAFQQEAKINPDRLILELYPHESIAIRLVNDAGKSFSGKPEVISEESLECAGEGCLPPYGKLILDAFLGDQTHFLSLDEILASWHFIDDLTRCVREHRIPLSVYPDGSAGPKEQADLLKQDGFTWYDPDRS